MCTKHPYRLSAITGPALLLLLTCSNAVMASSDARFILTPSPKTMLAVHPGLWRGDAVITTNGHTITHVVNVCVKHPHHFISKHTGAKLYGGYYPPTCKVDVSTNTKGSLAFQETCVPSQYIHTIINHPDRFNNFRTLPAYLFKRYKIISNRSGIIQVNVRKAEKRPTVRFATHSKGTPKAGSGGATKHFSQGIRGTFRYISSNCPQPIKIPTNKELRAEGRSVSSNRDLSRKLKSRLGYNPFSHVE